MLKFGKTTVTKEKIFAAKIPINTWDINIDNTVISKLVETKTNFKYLIECLDKTIRTLVLILPKMSEYALKCT